MQKKKNLQLSDLVKKAGFQLESNLNQTIKAKLNNTDLTRILANTQKNPDLQKLFGILIPAQKIPGNEDTANTSKLVVRTEEKIDSIEEKLLEIDSKLDEMRNLVAKNKKK
ncbi:hypothetical protein [Metabacillus sp. SLBN-84]